MSSLSLTLHPVSHFLFPCHKDHKSLPRSPIESQTTYRRHKWCHFPRPDRGRLKRNCKNSHFPRPDRGRLKRNCCHFSKSLLW